MNFLGRYILGILIGGLLTFISLRRVELVNCLYAVQYISGNYDALVLTAYNEGYDKARLYFMAKYYYYMSECSDALHSCGQALGAK